MGTVLEDIQGRFGKDVADKSFLYGAGLLVVFLFALWVRWLPADSMEYLQALDPYMIARMSGSIIENGSLPFVDAWRFFPFPTPTYMLNLGNIYVPAYLFYVVRLFGVSFLTWSKFYPALMGALTVIPVYLVIKRLFSSKAGLLSAFFLAASPAIMHRSSAGWFEKEPIANFFMMLSLWLFVKAWEEEDWLPGIGSGVFLALSATSWGGTKFMYLLYPTVAMVVVFVVPFVSYLPSVLFGDGLRRLETITGLFRAYTPTVILGFVLPWFLNGSRSTISLPSTFFLMAMAVLGVVGLRWAAERFELIEEKSLPFVGIWTVFAGGFAALLSPLYSQRLASMLQGFFNAALQTGGSVIGSTVAENQPASLGQVVQQTGSVSAGRVMPFLQPYTEYVSGWTFGLIGFSVLIVITYFIVRQSYSDMESLSDLGMVAGVMGTVAIVSILLQQLFRGARPSAFIPALVITGFGGVLYSIGRFLNDRDVEQWVVASIAIWAILFVFAAYTGIVLVAALLTVVAAGLIKASDDSEQTVKISFGWSTVLILVMIASTIYGAIQKSRLVFLASTPIAIGAGIGLSHVIDRVLSWEGWTALEDADPDMMVKKGAVLLAIVAVVIVNGAAVYVTGLGLGGSPNDQWMDNLEFMREETPPGSVIMSWWDYGYWFETIGERPAVADGGNMGYYTGENVPKINYPLADFLSSDAPANHTDWLERMGVDYIVLDNTMIGKYTAVSTIAKRGGSPDAMMQMNCVPDRVGGQRTCKQSTLDDTNVLHYSSNQLQQMMGRNAEILVPVAGNGRDDIEVAGTPLIRVGRTTIEIANVCGEDGIDELADGGTSGGIGEAARGAVRQDRPFGGCLAFDPARRPSGVVLVPPNTMESSLVRLYLMNGAGMDFVEPVSGGSNGFVRMWEVTG